METFRLIEMIVLTVAALDVVHAWAFESVQKAKTGLRTLLGIGAMFAVIELAIWWIG